MFHATPQRVLPAMQPMPQIFSVNRRATNAGSENAPSLSCSAWIRILSTGKKREHGDQQRNGDDAAGDERVALEVAALGEAEREQHRERRADERGAESHAELAAARACRSMRRATRTRPAARADREALHARDRRSRSRRARSAPLARVRRASAAGTQQPRRDQDQAERQRASTVRADRPAAAPARCPCLRIAQPADAEHRVLQRVPRDEQKPDRADDQPDERAGEAASRRAAVE